MRPTALIAPSLLSCNFAKLGDEANRMRTLGADWLHIDVMDGHFVPNLTLGPPIVKHLAKACPTAYNDCHMMVDDPIKWLDDFAEAPIHSMTIHVESPAFASTDSEEHQRLLLKALRQIKTKGVQPAIAIKPKTDIAPYLELFLQPANVHLLHMILVMTVEPGFGGQAFMSDCLSKVRAARKAFPQINIQVDGGLNTTTVKDAAAAGANVIVAGSAIFNAPDQAAYIKQLRASVDSHFAQAV